MLTQATPSALYTETRQITMDAAYTKYQSNIPTSNIFFLLCLYRTEFNDVCSNIYFFHYTRRKLRLSFTHFCWIRNFLQKRVNFNKKLPVNPPPPQKKNKKNTVSTKTNFKKNISHLSSFFSLYHPPTPPPSLPPPPSPLPPSYLQSSFYSAGASTIPMLSLRCLFVSLSLLSLCLCLCLSV